MVDMSNKFYKAFVAGYWASGEGANGEIMRDSGMTPEMVATTLRDDYDDYLKRKSIFCAFRQET